MRKKRKSQVTNSINHLSKHLTGNNVSDAGTSTPAEFAAPATAPAAPSPAPDGEEGEEGEDGGPKVLSKKEKEKLKKDREKVRYHSIAYRPSCSNRIDHIG